MNHLDRFIRASGARLAALALCVALLSGTSASAAGLKLGDDERYLKIALLLQGWAAFTHEGAQDPDSLQSDLYLRRMRVLLFGQYNEYVNFFVETDNPNFGKGGDLSPNTFIQDAWVELNLHPALQIDVGMLLTPFSHHGMQGAVTLHSLDYHSALIRYPRGSHKVWRDFGVMLRGMIVAPYLEYRVAICNGVSGSAEDPRNPNDWPRVTLRLTANVFEAEGGAGTGGFFYDGLYLSHSKDKGRVSPKRVLAFGVSADWQKDLNVSLDADGNLRRRDDYWAVAADVFLDLPLLESKQLALTGQLNVYYYDHGDRRGQTSPDGETISRSWYGAEGGGSEYSGVGLLSELGLRWDWLGVYEATDWFHATESSSGEGDYLSEYGGLIFWWFGHGTSIKLESGGIQRDGGDWQVFARAQVQLLF